LKKEAKNFNIELGYRIDGIQPSMTENIYSQLNPKPSIVVCNFPALLRRVKPCAQRWCAARETFATLTAPNAAACCFLDCRKITAPQ